MVAYESLTTKERNQLGNAKSGRGLLREQSLTRAFNLKSLKSRLKRGFTKVVVTRVGLRTRVVARRASTVHVKTDKLHIF